MSEQGQYNVVLLHIESKIKKLEHRRKVHLLNFVYHRSRIEEYTQKPNRELCRYDAPILLEILSNNDTFRRNILY